MRPVVVYCIILLCAVVLRSEQADAQWHSDSLTNTPVCVARYAQTHPAIASDGAGGAYIVWQDIRSTYNWDIYAQHIDADGEALWGPSGLAICTSNFDQYSPIIEADGWGGAFIVWSGGTDIYAQHVAADGSLSYDANGIAIGQATRDQRNPVMTLVKPGRAIVAFEDLRSVNSASRPDISLNIITPQGAVYGAGGFEVVVGTGGQRQPRIISDNKGSALMAWETEYGLPVGVQASLLDSNGSLKWNGGGAAPGLTMFRGLASTNDASNISLGISGQKFLLAWEVKNASSNLGQDLYANRVNKTGEKDWFSGIEVTGEWPSDQSNPTIVADDSNGFIIFFEDYAGDIPPRYLNRDIAAVRFRANGIDRIPAFADGFSYVVKQSRAQRYYDMVEADDRFYFTWDDARGSTDDTAIYVQAVDKTLNRYYPTFGTSSSWGKPIAVRKDAQQEHATICKREGGGVIIAWSDNRSGDADIYAQVMFPNGTLPIELAAFNVRENEGTVTIEWKTAMEKDLAGFEVERRNAMSDEYQVIASYKRSSVLRGSGNTNYEKPYAVTDHPVPGIYEYRIADVALDGTRKTHQARQINTTFAVNPEWNILPPYPNPANEKVIFGIQLAEAATAEVEVRNMLGQLIETRSVHQDFPGYTFIELPTKDYINGTYLYRATIKSDGATLWTGPLQRFQIVR
jgi:hypothetical protein